MHCGEPTSVVGMKHPETVFCCAGCKTAYQLIQGWELDAYYDLRDQLGSSRETRPGSNQGCEIFDNVELLGQSAPRDLGDGVMESRIGLQGLHCGACAWLIENAASRTPGWISARVKMNDQTLTVSYSPETISLTEIAQLLASLGYQPVPILDDGNDRSQHENRAMLIQIAIAGFCAANAMWIAIALYAAEATSVAEGHYHFLRWASTAIGLFAVVFPGRTFFRGALASIKTRTPHMDLPVALGLSIGTLVGLFNAVSGTGEIYFDSLAVLVFLLLIGRWIQFRQQYRAARAVDLMIRVTPASATRIAGDGSLQTVSVQTLIRGHHIRVAAGESFPADGEIVSGSTAIDQSLLTGESAPVERRSGDKVCAGTVNVLRPVDVEVEATGSESRVGQVMSLVENASDNKPAIVQLADRIGGVFVLVVTLLATVSLVIWYPRGWRIAAEHATALLIVACPCALALATPLAIAISLARSARRRILIRDGNLLQLLAGKGTIWFDKTGTLTRGCPKVTAVIGKQTDVVLSLAAAVEQHSVHPIAKAIVDEARQRALAIPAPDAPSEMMLGGIQGKVRGRTVRVGNREFMQAHHVDLGSVDRTLIRQAECLAQSPVCVATNDELVGVLIVADPPRENAKRLLNDLKRQGWKIGILSGDNSIVVESIGRRLGLDADQTRGAISPEGKLDAIRESQRAGEVVVMVGDGANDAAALAAADVGIAVRGGAEASLHAAPIYVASGQLSSIGELFRGASSSRSLIYTTFAVSLAYNLAAVGLAITGNISPLIAAILMPISSVSVLAITLSWPTFRETCD
ncbi:MAG: heavy metal translocating P-type ATPase metal-binding domain-containing protein [Planctomycetota bacterium]